MARPLRDRLEEGDRRIVGAAGAVADEVRQNPALLSELVDLLGDTDPAVVAHTSHALMQIGLSDPSLFDPFVEILLDRLAVPAQWEIGEQLPKILVRTRLTENQAQRLFAILRNNTRNSSNIVAACSLQGIVDLARDGRASREDAENALEAAIKSDRKALAARARRLRTELLKP
ncbi:MAG: hypothetical protein AAGC96_04100 [Pseudomonadota bacterium]